MKRVSIKIIRLSVEDKKLYFMQQVYLKLYFKLPR